MSISAQLYWSFRSPYSYLGIKRYREMERVYGVEIEFRPVQPIAIRDPEFFERVNAKWLTYLLKDCTRVAEFYGLPFQFPSPDPVVMDLQTREIAIDQPYIHWLTRLGVEAARRSKGIAFADEVSTMIWGGTRNWHHDENLVPAVERAGLDLDELCAAVNIDEAGYDAEIEANHQALDKAGHWGAPTLVINNEVFYGQDRIGMSVWRMKQLGARAGQKLLAKTLN